MSESGEKTYLTALPEAFLRAFDSQVNRDIRKVALWLGHASTQTTEMYLRADATTLLEAMNETLPPTLRKGCFKAPDQLIAILNGR